MKSLDRCVVEAVRTGVSGVRIAANAIGGAPESARSVGRAWVEQFEYRDGEPEGRSKVRLAAEAAIDEVILASFRLSVLNRVPAIFKTVEAEVDEATALFESNGWFDDPLSYYEDPPALVDPVVRSDRIAGLDFERLSFESGYEPHAGEPGRARWLGYDDNRVAHAWVLRHDEDRPWVLVSHGAMMGRPRVDLVGFRAAWMHRKLGLNVAMPVMPLHGPRGTGMPKILQLPVDDPIDTVHAFAQSLWDSRRLLGWIQAQTAQPIGLKALSLGTFTAGLLAATEPDLAAVVMGIPAVDLGQLYESHMPDRLRSQPEIVRFMAESRGLLDVISPLSFDPLIERDRRFLYAGTRDRLAQGEDHVSRLWHHWDEPELHWFAGSHIGFLLSSSVNDFVRDAFTTSGLVTPAEPPPSAAAGV